MSSIDQQFVEYIVKSLVSKPDEVSIERRIDEKGVLLELTVDPEDLGRVIGKRGATAQSLRTLLRALGTKNDARYNLKIVDNGEAPGGGSSRSGSDAGTAGAPSDDSWSAQPPAGPGVAAPADEDTSAESDVVKKTRAELSDLDDLDV
jgi:predicted RNA-binding protein YlqC (UPF0109 family)